MSRETSPPSSLPREIKFPFNNSSVAAGSRRSFFAQNLPGISALMLIAIGFSVVPLLNTVFKPEANKDYTRWWSAATAVRTGGELYPAGFNQSFIYPPASAVIFYTPLSLLGYPAMVALVCAIGALSYLAVVVMSVKYATGRATWQHPLIYIIPVVATLGYVWDIFFLGQPNLMLLALMLTGFALLDRSWNVAAGSLFALAAVLKAFPATVLVYLVWRRRWKAAATMVLATALLLLVLPVPFRGFERNLQETRTWVSQMVLGTSGTALANQPDRAFKYGNQSLMSVVHRLTRDVDAVGPDKVPGGLRVNLLSISSSSAFVFFALIAGVLGLAYIFSMTPEALRSPRGNAMEYAALLLLMVLFSPKAGTYYYCWSMPALAIITAEIVRAPPGVRARTVLIAGLTVSCTLAATALGQLFNILLPQALGATMWAGFVLVVLLLWLMYRERRALLDRAEKRIEQLTETPEGLKAEPFDPKPAPGNDTAD